MAALSRSWLKIANCYNEVDYDDARHDDDDDYDDDDDDDGIGVYCRVETMDSSLDQFRN